MQPDNQGSKFCYAKKSFIAIALQLQGACALLPIADAPTAAAAALSGSSIEPVCFVALLVAPHQTNFVDCTVKKDQKCVMCHDQASNCGGWKTGLCWIVRSGVIPRPGDEDIARERQRRHPTNHMEYCRRKKLKKATSEENNNSSNNA